MDQSQQVVMARQMPASLEAEQAVIGAMLLDQDAVNTAAEQLLAEDFYYPAYAVMYTTIVDLYNESRVVDAVAVTEKLKTAGLAVEYTEPRFIAELMNSVPTSANIG
jgi:replicative DNA helicase